MKFWRRIVAYFSMFCMTLLATLIVGGTCLVIWYVYQTDRGGRDISHDVAMETNEIQESLVPMSDGETLLDGGATEQDTIEQETVEDLVLDEETMKKNRIHQIETKGDTGISLLFAGDMLFDDSYAVMGTYQNRGNVLENGFSEDLIREMRDADICMINNEFPYSRRGTPIPGKAYTFRAEPTTVSILQDLGVDIVSLANNHASDYGTESLIDTVFTLQNAGIAYVGAGLNYEDASHPVYYMANGIKIAFVSATQIEQTDNPDTKGATETSPGVHRAWNDDRVFDVIREAKANSDFVVFYVHWGTESTTELSWGQTNYVGKYVEAGADLIIGDHPHVLQKIDIVDGVPVIYSIGNFWFNSKGRDTCYIRCVVDQDGLQSFQFVPCAERDCMTIMLAGEEKERVIRYEQSISPEVVLDQEGFLQLHSQSE